MKISIIGTGNVAKALAGKLLAAGHAVSFASRDPEGKTGLAAPVTSLAEVAAADVVIAATPGAATLATLKEIGEEALKGKIIIDLGNAVDQNFNLIYPNASLGAAIQAALPQSHVVKAWNTFAFPVMTNPRLLKAPSSAFMSGNDADAKKVVAGLHHDLGWAADELIDLGGIEAARGQEHYFLFFFPLMRALGGGAFNIAVVR